MGWNRTPVRDAQWKVHPYWTKQSQALEQDRAAGGRDRRIIKEGGALGRVVLRRWHRRIYAELRWQINNEECSTSLREVSADNREANLAAAWQRAHDLGLTRPTTSAPG